jgi:hypothetical protein
LNSEWGEEKGDSNCLDCKKEKGTGYFSGDLRGRPRGRSVESKPKVAAMVACQAGVPNGCCRFTQVRRAVRRRKGDRLLFCESLRAMWLWRDVRVSAARGMKDWGREMGTGYFSVRVCVQCGYGGMCE